MSCAELHQAHFASAEKDRQLAFEGEGGPGQAGDAFRILEQARKAPILGIPILLAALLDQPVGFVRCDNALRLVGGGPQYAHRVIVRQHHIFDRLVGYRACASNTMQPSSPTMTAEFGSPSAVKA